MAMRKVLTLALVAAALLGTAACGKRGDPMRPDTGQTVNLPETTQPRQHGTYESNTSGTTPQPIF
ncbi:hypothetical protein L2U69_13810 [Zavarzinia compransoris]|uniref:hypothetical protein n=1 Tax=Zavarzinia marina TaxID=2911065 RepID=UPI001F32B6FE|nr:hypothetical protein [Zavarzinia marina]MCF4166723.1 hypothetical protein [Zavarzinia marina]